MSEQPRSSSPAWAPKVSSLVSIFSVVVGISVLAGWFLHIAILKSWLPGQVTMRVNTAVGFILLGIALWLLQIKPEAQATRPYHRWLADALSGTVLLIGMLTLAEHLFGWDLGIDQWLFSVRPGEDVGAVRPGLMSPITALDFTLLGSAVLLLDCRSRRGTWPSQFLCVAAMLASLAGTLDFILRQPVTHTHISLPSAVTFFVFSWGVIYARPAWVLAGLLTSQTSGARWLRRTVPAVLLLLTFLAWLLSKPLLTTVHFSWSELNVIALFVSLWVAAFLGWTASLLDRNDRRRGQAEAALNLSPEKLDQLMERYKDATGETTARGWSRAGITLGVALTCLGFFGSWHSMRQEAADDDWVAHTQTVRTAIEATLASCAEVEAGARTYAATGDETFLASSQVGEQAVADDLHRLRSLTADNPAQQPRLERLGQEIDARIGSAQRTIEERQRTGRVPAHALLLEGERRMSVVRATIHEMQNEETRLLEQRQSNASNTRKRTEIVTLVSALAGVTLLLLAGVITNREINRSTRLRGQIQALNSDLEGRVEKRTRELRQSEERLRLSIEEIRKLNEELERRVHERTAELEAANKELEAFTYSVSHDLRAPLRHIGGFSKLLTEDFSGSLPPEAQHHLQRIEEGTRRMGQLVDDLLNLARVGRRQLSLQVTGLNSLVDEVMESLKPDVGDRQVEWKVGKLPFVECDPALLKQALQNLLANALKFTRTRSPTVIEIDQREENGTPVIYVRDNGVGFSMKYADKLFGVFQRLHRQEDFEGTGVGLATVQRIIQKHGGRIWAEAELDKGATFSFTLGNSEPNAIKTKSMAAGEPS